MRSFGFAWRSLAREPARAALGIAGVAIVGALLLDMLLLSRGLVLSLREILRSTGFDVRVTATTALPGFGPPIGEATAVARQIAALPEVASVAPIRFGRAWAVGRGGGSFSISLVGTGARERNEWRIVSGHDLSYAESAGPPQVVVNVALAEAGQLAAGSSLVLVPGDSRPSSLPATTFQVAGIAEFPFEARGEPAAKITFDAFRAANFGSDADEAEMLMVRSRGPGGAPAAVAAIERLRPDLEPYTIEELLDRLRRTDFTYFRQIALVLSTITCFFAALLVTTLLTVSVNQRLGEIAALRAVGLTRLRVSLDLLAESVLLLAAGGLLALPLGAGTAAVLDRILRDIPGLPEQLHFFVPDARALVLFGAILGGSALVAAAYPVWIAARLPIAATLRREVVS